MRFLILKDPKISFSCAYFIFSKMFGFKTRGKNAATLNFFFFFYNSHPERFVDHKMTQDHVPK